MNARLRRTGAVLRALDAPSRWSKLGIVVMGYALALAATVLAMALYDRRFSAADQQTMVGMIAGGEMMYGGGVFITLSFVPTALGCWYLRRHYGAWSWLANLCLGWAALGVPAVILTVLLPYAPRSNFYELFSLLGVMQMLSAPLWGIGFVLLALLAPAPELRRRLIGAVALELVCAAIGAWHFLPAMLRH